ncbi:MAG TPA: polysaccharide deacetylase family protein [Candidatus Saccharimonadales bacterium]
MRKGLWIPVSLCAALILQVAFILQSPTAEAAGPNLIANPSLENGTTAPNNWIKNSWGQNTATFTYKKNEGYQSSRSVRVQLSNYVSGDAKWYFNAVNVEPNTTYTFSDYYKSNKKTKAVAVSYDAAGAPTYTDIALNIAASNTDWKQVTAKYTTLASTKKLSVFHVIEQNGWLQIDKASVTKDDVVPPTPANSVPNPSVEASSGTPAMPTSWHTGSWGSNTPAYEYVNEGRTGNRSVKLTMSNYVDGDAKWYFEPQQLEKGKDYRFSAWYKTNTIPNVVVRYITSSGTDRYFGMPRPEPNGTTNWQQYSDTFSVPEDAQSVTVFFFLSSNGWLQLDDFSVTPYQTVGFSRPLVSLTYDDGFEENVTTVLPRLNGANIKSTQCYATQFIEGQPAQVQNVMAFKNSGHEICSHTVTHPALSQLNTADLTYELTHSKQYLESTVGLPVTSFASPFGDYNAAVNNEIKKYYRSHRTVDEGYNSKDNFNIYKIRVQNMQATTTLAEFQGWINKAKADKTWLVFVYHRVTPGEPGQFDTKESDFVQQLNALVASGVTVKTYNEALNEVIPQL